MFPAKCFDWKTYCTVYSASVNFAFFRKSLCRERRYKQSWLQLTYHLEFLHEYSLSRADRTACREGFNDRIERSSLVLGYCKQGAYRHSDVQFLHDKVQKLCWPPRIHRSQSIFLFELKTSKIQFCQLDNAGSLPRAYEARLNTAKRSIDLDWMTTNPSLSIGGRLVQEPCRLNHSLSSDSVRFEI